MPSSLSPGMNTIHKTQQNQTNSHKTRTSRQPHPAGIALTLDNGRPLVADRLDDAGRRLFVANGDSDEISVVDTSGLRSGR
ncbi:hypothetical protein [Saccharopolyspora sp. NPDC002376]